MMEFISANMAPIMFGSLIVFLLFGYSVAFSLAACGLLFGFIGIELGLLPSALMQALPLRMFGIMQNDTLLAVPFFTFMGLLSNARAWPRTCSTPSASCSARSAAASRSR